MTYAIAEAAHRTGLSIDTLRYYERIELVDPPARDSGGRRAYSDEDLAWLGFLTRLRTTGMPIKLMREYARLRHQGIASAGQRKRILERHREDVRARIEELRSCLGALDYKIDNYERVIGSDHIQEASA
ncbi:MULTISPECIES: MerR family transcriptional regulator [Actinokineospora]|uniref:MerR family transcriptional regulator n=3 Tax=Actinokineospora TaxID=39845 RepID=A0A9W6QVL8_9PSEU|nr:MULTISPECIES: MerR family transcriptional regulator [Actinokineospora]MCP2302024.1 transcriptional regulator, MerR family [Actinokineospora globicatena]RLK60979.1 DNA-binding transcriptional MerR regulator [Actinokineospora cianjurensis]SER81802.1 transcriptional regulator, MerR family [Actinokineospora terrae]GLW76314.1 MerR family transcriptional regulator [Actinokineospora globicatena]GLW83150.1 MerR family transcriptional regulator [Actinokineospora globicatena]